MRRVFQLAVAIFLLAAAIPTFAQTVTTTGSITGVVTDPTGAVVSNATVTATQVETNVATSAQTNRDGSYTLRFLPIGHYTVSASAPGFASQTVQPFALEINQTVKLANKLNIGNSSENVTVNADTAPILNTTDATLSTTFTQNEIENLPLNDRNFETIALFTPGVVLTDPTGLTGGNATERATTSNDLISGNGNRGQANNIVVDGVEINEGQNNQIGYNVSPDAIEQIQVITGNASAQYGNANGTNQVIVLKSGTNQFHGSAFVYLQNWRLNANSWSNKHVLPGVPFNPRTKYTQTFFGGTFGGPIIRDKLFFFGDYEGIRVPSGGHSVTTVLTPDMLQGNFSALLTPTTGAPALQLYNTQAYNAATNSFPAYPGNMGLPVNNPVAKYLAAHPGIYPAPNHAPAPKTYIGGNYQFPYSAGQRSDQFDVKIDYTPTSKDRFNGFYAQSRAGDNFGPRAGLPITFNGINDYPTTLFGINWIRTFSSSLVNLATVGFSRTKWENNRPIDSTGQFGLNGDSVVGIPFGTQQYVGFSSQGMSDNGYGASVGTPGAPQILADNTFSYTDNLTIQRGAHLFTIGVQASRYQQSYNQSQNGGGLGSFSYTGQFTSNPQITPTATSSAVGYGPADFIINAVSDESLLNGGVFQNLQWRSAGYIQDQWKVRTNLTLNIGVRYEYDEPMLEAHNHNANVLPLNFGTMEYSGSIPANAPPGSILCPTLACYKSNFKQVMPRVGFAWQPYKSTSLRGGYGSTSFFEGNAANQRLTNNPPLVSAFNRTANGPNSTSGGQAFDVTKGFATNATANHPSGGSFSQWPQNIQPALIQQYNLTLEQAFGAKTLFSLGYVGQGGKHLMMYGNANQFTQAQAYDVYVAYANNPAALPSYDLSPYYNLGAGTSYAAGNGGGVLSTASRAVSGYNAMQTTLRQRASHGLEFTVNYTWAKSMTNGGGNYGVPNVSIPLTFQDWYNGRPDIGPSGDDIRNNANAIVVYAIPFGRGRAYGADSSLWLDEIAGGWTITNAYTAYSGLPVTLFASTSQNAQSYGPLRPNQYRKMRIVNRSINNWWGSDPSAVPCTVYGVLTTTDNGVCAYGNPSQYAFGTASNSTERAPGYTNLDTAVYKDFRIYREHLMSFRADIFNVLNLAEYGNPDSGIADSTFGVISSVRNQERRMQLGLKYKF